MRSAGVVLLLVAWLAAWAAAAASGWVPAEALAVAWPMGILVAAVVAWRSRGPQRRSDPVSRIEAQRRARERFEADREQRARVEGASRSERRELEAAARAEARVRELRERRRRPPGDPPDPGG